MCQFPNRYPNYKFIGDADIANSASLATRYTDNSLLGILIDFYFLSNSDYLVCTFSSQVKKRTITIMRRISIIKLSSDMQRRVWVKADVVPRRSRPDPLAGRHLLLRRPGNAWSGGCDEPHCSKTWRDWFKGRWQSRRSWQPLERILEGKNWYPFSFFFLNTYILQFILFMCRGETGALIKRAFSLHIRWLMCYRRGTTQTTRNWEISNLNKKLRVISNNKKIHSCIAYIVILTFLWCNKTGMLHYFYLILWNSIRSIKCR